MLETEELIPSCDVCFVGSSCSLCRGQGDPNAGTLVPVDSGLQSSGDAAEDGGVAGVCIDVEDETISGFDWMSQCASQQMGLGQLLPRFESVVMSARASYKSGLIFDQS